jgi:hypothetical protein
MTEQYFFIQYSCKKGKNKIKARTVNDGKSRYFLTDLCKIKKKYRQQKHKSILLDRLQEFSVYASFKNVLECLREKSHRNRSNRHRNSYCNIGFIFPIVQMAVPDIKSQQKRKM